MRKISKGNIKDYPDYFVTKDGKVYSKYKKNRWVKLSSNRVKSNGYSIVSIRDINDNKKTFGIHQLVAMVYVPNPDNKPCVCHKDNDRTHNHYKNLYWGTHKENSEQMVRDGRHYHPDTHIPLESIYDLFKDIDNHMPYEYLKDKYKLNSQQIYSYKRRRSYYEQQFRKRKL